MATHSSIGASSAHRWFACPGSIKLSAQAPEQESSPYAEQGTAAHWVAEECFIKEVDPYDYIGVAAPNGYELTRDDIESVEKYLDFMKVEQSKGKFIAYSEIKFDLECIYPGLFGTADRVLVESNLSRLKIYDYKHGSGTPVNVENNKQLLYYALGAIKYVCTELKIDYLDVLGWGKVFKEVEICIVQPRCRHKDGYVRSWVVPPATLESFAEELKIKAEEVFKENAPFNVGSHCKFCKAMPICSAFNGQAMEIAKADFKSVSHPSNLNLPSAEQLTVDEIKKVLDFADLISDFLKKVESHAQQLLEHGEKIPGYKLVEKRANRDWKDEDEAKAALELFLPEEELYTKKFVSPSKAEKALGKGKKKIVEDLCYKPNAGLTLAAEHDPRQEVAGSAKADFEIIEQTNRRTNEE